MNARRASVAAVLILSTVFASVAGDDRQEIKTTLQSLIEEGRHPDLRWPDFSDYREHVRDFYRKHGFRLAWFYGGAPTWPAGMLAKRLAAADVKGLNVEDYEGTRWQSVFRELERDDEVTAADFASADLAFTVSVMRYISDLRIGRVDPNRMGFEFEVARKKYDLPAFVSRLAKSEEIGDPLGELEPTFDVYWRLLRAHRNYRELATRFPWRAIEHDGTVRPGEPFSDARYLARLLAALGDLAPEGVEPASRNDSYTAELADAVTRFQERHGLDVDGVMGPATFRALATPLTDRLEQIRLALERMRWVPEPPESRAIVVNVPAFQLRALEVAEGADRVALAMKVIVGKTFPQRRTPVFVERMSYLEFSPYWNVPYSIARESLIPAIEEDPREVERRNLEIVAAFGPNAKPLEPSMDNIAKLRSYKLKLRQKPGPDNALGPAKFIFPNSHAVYLHGTPARQLFERSRRTFSSGCIRVEDPTGLAEYILRDREEWNRDAIEAAMSSGRPKRVVLDEPIPVYIIYATALPAEDGRVFFWEDIYGHDRALADALARGYPYPW